MLLRHLYDLAQSRNLLNDLAFAPKAVRWVIALDEAGNLLGSGPIETTGDKVRPTDEVGRGLKHIWPVVDMRHDVRSPH